MSKKRLLKQFNSYKIQPAAGIQIKLDENDEYLWHGILLGPQDSPYFGGMFNVDIKIPEQYPFKPPKVNFTTKIYHPGITQKNGDLCCCYVQDITHSNWSPALTIQKVLIKYRQHLLVKTIEKYVDYCGDRIHVFNQFKFNRQLFIKNAQEWTQKYAMEANQAAGAE